MFTINVYKTAKINLRRHFKNRHCFMSSGHEKNNSECDKGLLKKPNKKKKLKDLKDKNEAKQKFIVLPMDTTKARKLVEQLSKEQKQIVRAMLKETEEPKIRHKNDLAAKTFKDVSGRETDGKRKTFSFVSPYKLPKCNEKFCTLPSEWLYKKTKKPTAGQLIVLMINSALPYFAFGFLDNAMMVIFGDYIDEYLHPYGFSVMTSAALGNTVGDVIGISLSVYIEQLVKLIGIQYNKLSAMQLELPIVRRCSEIAKPIGILIGCLFGMIPLLLIKLPE